jgi:hypothetical protein
MSQLLSALETGVGNVGAGLGDAISSVGAGVGGAVQGVGQGLAGLAHGLVGGPAGPAATPVPTDPGTLAAMRRAISQAKADTDGAAASGAPDFHAPAMAGASRQTPFSPERLQKLAAVMRNVPQPIAASAPRLAQGGGDIASLLAGGMRPSDLVKLRRRLRQPSSLYPGPGQPV